MMKKSMRHKRILRLLVFTLLITLFSISPVSAAKKKCNVRYSDDQIIERYGAKIKQGAVSNKFVISLNPKSSDSNVQSKLRKVVFKITKINGNDVTSEGMTVAYKNKLTIYADPVDVDGEKTVEVEMEATEKDIDPGCTGKVTLAVSISRMGDEIVKNENISLKDNYNSNMIGEWAIDCSKVAFDPNKYENNLSFETRFCYSKMKALASKKYTGKNVDEARNFSEAFNSNGIGTYNEDKKKYFDKDGKEIELKNQSFQDIGKDKRLVFKCDYKSFYKPEDLKYTDPAQEKSDHANDIDKYYKESNRQYVYGSGVVTKDFGQYVYHYVPGEGGYTATEDVSCKVRCEEAVVVEYGPPIASKAGLCFEYQIKVTSRVSCDLAKNVEPPKVEAKYCTPTPICTNGKGYYGNQGGPNEEFDSCIKACDGGKYTEKCSNKCYKKVYGTKGLSKTKTSLYNSNNLELLGEDDDVRTPGGCAKVSTDGCYYRDGSGSMMWQGGQEAGRWYREAAHKDLSEYIVGTNGIYRHQYKNGTICNDTCSWTGCEDNNMYLNPGIAQHDYDNNYKIYEVAVSECKAAATCTEETATFKIETNYSHYVREKDEEATKTTLNFPYTRNEDKITSGLKEGASTQITKDEKKDTTILVDGGSNGIKKDSHIIKGTGKGNGKGYAGCYRNNAANNWYQTEWSFPGTWINNKTGEISYKNVGDTTGWQTLEGKMCLPVNAQPVNTKWWNKYYNKVFAGKDSSVTNEKFESECKSEENSIITPKTNIKDSDIKWNIKGFSTKFGYFKWNFEIDCFYALNENITGLPDKTTSSTKEKCMTPVPNNPKYSYIIRTVDLKNLFPDKSGGTSNRTPGFNWSKYAENNKNSSYTSNPAKYLEEVQKENYNIYSDRYLDYEFELTPATLSEMRKTNAIENNKYTNFDGTVKEVDGITVYSSKAIRSLPNANTKVPAAGKLCNNLVNHNGGCESKK